MIEYKKKSYVMKAELITSGTMIYNFLNGDCYFVSGNAKRVKLIGTVGEECVVTLEELSKTYTLADGTNITHENIPDGVFDIVAIVDDFAETVFAEQTTKKIAIATSWGKVLTANSEGVPHGDGDFIVFANKDGKPNLKNSWVVNGMVFNNIYTPVNS